MGGTTPTRVKICNRGFFTVNPATLLSGDAMDWRIPASTQMAIRL